MQPRHRTMLFEWVLGEVFQVLIKPTNQPTNPSIQTLQPIHPPPTQRTWTIGSTKQTAQPIQPSPQRTTWSEPPPSQPTHPSKRTTNRPTNQPTKQANSPTHANTAHYLERAPEEREGVGLGLDRQRLERRLLSRVWVGRSTKKGGEDRRVYTHAHIMLSLYFFFFF